jgi:hypothetical protein
VNRPDTAAQVSACGAAHVGTEARLAAFARAVLRILQDDPQWSPDTLQDDPQWSPDTLQAIADGAHARGLTTRGDPFKAAPGILEPPAPGRTRKDYGAPVRVWCDGAWYTAMPPRSERAAAQWRHDDGTWECVVIRHDGTHGRADAYAPGPHLGARVAWGDIPPAVQAQLRASFLADYCPKVEA